MKNDEPLISVIVPVYNGQDYLAGCIDSIENQTYENLEVLIINDGSTDRTPAVCEALEASYDNVRILNLDDEGVSAARNIGMREAAGEFITFADADDRLRPEMIRLLYDCIVETQSDVAGCKFIMWSSDAEWERLAGVPGEHKTSGQTKIYDAGTYLKEELLSGNSRCWSKLYRRRLIEKVRFTEGLTIGEDMLFLVKMLPYVEKIAETDYPGYGYYRNPTGTINRKFTSRYMDQITCWQLAREEILRMDESLDPQVSALWMMGIMLAAGKIAMLPADERHDCSEYIGICRERLKEAMKIPGAYGRLSVGYRVKTMMFRVFPQLYLSLYHLHKKAD
ncbi:MAG: glycosyltransferase [Lachnospiraceae bacterium]|nr:glycosyltransferase [Lachnospiraceae bacterium]